MGIEFITNSKSKTFLAFCFCFLIGVVAASLLIEGRVDFFYFYLSLVVFLPLVVVFFEQIKIRFLLICGFLLFFGFFYYSFAFPGDNHIAQYNGEEVEFSAVVADYPEVGVDDIEYILEVEKINGEDISGKVLLRNKLYPRYNYGDKIQLECKLSEPEPFNGFRYDMYLANFDVFSICRYAQVSKISENKGNVFLSSIFSLKRKMIKQANKLWHEPSASLISGLLFGSRGGLGRLEKTFNQAGITHIVAISGLHVTIVSLVLMSLCIHCNIPRNKAFWLVSFGILFYVIFTGMSASVIRAGIMGFLVLLAKKLGRGAAIINTLVLTAVIMTLINPFNLVWNGGFQLSFLATIGLIYLADDVNELFSFVPNILEAREALSATISALVLTLPLVLYLFNLASLVAPLTNVLVVWSIPIIIISGFITLIVSFISMTLADILSWLVNLGLEYILAIVRFVTDFSFAAVQLDLPLWVMLFSYIVLFIWLYHRESTNDKTLDIS